MLQSFEYSGKTRADRKESVFVLNRIRFGSSWSPLHWDSWEILGSRASLWEWSSL